ncbi:E3 SUMO-protein ligase PIAS4-A-like isoform X2 [Hoplias malabaricus]|uniref:E3 SUMO-protein ligase PIAS4-A-like isoform X2 n=1 Tax=Hoplias malabaricus TaxID=27720 RepID=UPI003461D5BB
MSVDLQEAMNMVESLPVAELRSLLSTMGKNKKGLKRELVLRIKELLQKECRPEILFVIQDVYQHRQSSKASNRSNIPSSAEVQMFKLPMYDTLQTIVAPMALATTVGLKLHSSLISFQLTQSQLARLKNSQEPKSGLKPLQVVLRFCYTESIGVEEDQYPPQILVIVNGWNCSPQVRYSSSAARSEPSRPCYPINLTPLLRQTDKNLVTIFWRGNDKHYSAAVYLVRVFTSADLLEQLQNKAVESKEQCRQKICEKLCCDSENEIATTGLRVSLICPLAKTRMSTPCRAQSCAHLQCFDAGFYLQMNEIKPRWTCPVCHKPAPFETLQIDSLLSGILQSTKQTVKEIEYLSNGSWKEVSEKRESIKIPDPSSLSFNDDDVVDLTQCSSDDDDDDKLQCNKRNV